MIRYCLLPVASILLLAADASAGADAGPAKAPDAGAAVTPAPAPDARAAPRVKVVRIRDMLLAAIASYQQSEFQRARQQLREIQRYVGQDQTRAAQECYTYLALVHLAFDESDAAVGALEKALSINPELKLPSSSPKIEAALQQARRRYRAKVRAMDHDPPRLRHTPPARGKYGSVLSLTATVSDPSGVARVVLHYRQAGNRGFSSVTMERPKGQRRSYLATVPALSVIRPGVEYYVEAWDVLGNGPGLKGSAAKPILVPVKGGPMAAAAPPPPLYKRWWFWTAVGGAAAATGGIIAAAVLTRKQNSKIQVVEIPPGMVP